MKVSTKVTGLSLLVLFLLTSMIIIFSMAWSKQTIERLTKLYFKEKLETLIFQAEVNDDLYFEGIYPSEDDAKHRVAAELLNYYQASDHKEILPFIFDEKNRVILLPTFKPRQPIPKEMNGHHIQNKNRGSFTAIINKTEYFIIFKKFLPWKWTFGFAVPKNIINNGVNREFKLLILLAMSSLFFFSVLMLALLKTAFSPLLKLTNAVQSVKQGDFDTLKKLFTDNSEIGILSSEFQTMGNEVERKIIQLKKEVTKRTQTANELDKTRIYLTNIYNSIQSAMIIIDKNIKILDWNTITENYIKIPLNEAKGKSLFEIMPKMLRTELKIKKTFATGKKQLLNKQHFSINNQSYCFAISFYPMKEDTEKKQIIVIDDISEIDQKEKQLIQAQKMESVGNLAGGLAHDFNNILGGIKGANALVKTLLKIAKPDLKKIEEFINLSETSADRAAGLVKQLLSISRKKHTEF